MKKDRDKPRSFNISALHYRQDDAVRAVLLAYWLGIPLPDDLDDKAEIEKLWAACGREAWKYLPETPNNVGHPVGPDFRQYDIEILRFAERKARELGLNPNKALSVTIDIAMDKGWLKSEADSDTGADVKGSNYRRLKRLRDFLAPRPPGFNALAGPPRRKARRSKNG
jgi:hypothetical protein